MCTVDHVGQFTCSAIYATIYKIMLIFGSGSIPDAAYMTEFCLTTISSGILYDTVKSALKKGADFMKKMLLPFGLVACGSMV